MNVSGIFRYSDDGNDHDIRPIRANGSKMRVYAFDEMNGDTQWIMFPDNFIPRDGDILELDNQETFPAFINDKNDWYTVIEALKYKRSN